MKKLSLFIIALFITIQIFGQDSQPDGFEIERTIRFKDFLAPDYITALAIAIVGGVWAYIQSKIQKANTRAEVYNQFQEKFKEFQSKLPSWINKRDEDGKLSEPQGEEEKAEFNRTIESYWWLVFDEWVVCCQEARYSCRRLWRRYYSKGIQNALERDYFVEALSRLVKRENSFLGHDAEFLYEIKKLYKEKYDIELFSTLDEAGKGL